MKFSWIQSSCVATTKPKQLVRTKTKAPVSRVLHERELQLKHDHQLDTKRSKETLSSPIHQQNCLIESHFLCESSIRQDSFPCEATLLFAVYSLSHVQLSAKPWTVARQAPLSMEFPRQGYWHVLPFPSPEDLPDPAFLVLAGRFFTTLPWNGVGRVMSVGAGKCFTSLAYAFLLCKSQ